MVKTKPQQNQRRKKKSHTHHADSNDREKDNGGKCGRGSGDRLGYGRGAGGTIGWSMASGAVGGAVMGWDLEAIVGLATMGPGRKEGVMVERVMRKNM